MREGRCLCGAVKFTAEGARENFSACHCEMCRRWGSGPLLSVGAKSVAFDGESALGRYRSSEWAERGFCKVCGWNLFYHMLKEDRYMMAVGAFDDQSGFEIARQVFIDEKPGFYDLEPLGSTSTGDDFFTRYPALKEK